MTDDPKVVTLPVVRIERLGTVIDEIAAERKRQKDAEGWSESHDDEHDGGALAVAAACYAISDHPETVKRLWNWDWKWWKPKDRRRDLIRAGALIVAEIERLDRAAQ